MAEKNPSDRAYEEYLARQQALNRTDRPYQSTPHIPPGESLNRQSPDSTVRRPTTSSRPNPNAGGGCGKWMGFLFFLLLMGFLNFGGPRLFGPRRPPPPQQPQPQQAAENDDRNGVFERLREEARRRQRELLERQRREIEEARQRNRNGAAGLGEGVRRPPDPPTEADDLAEPTDVTP